LNTRLRGNSAAVLAHQLFTVLDRRLPPRLNQVSDQPGGSLSDPLNPEPLRVGDCLKVSDTQGTVEDIGLRSTRIRTLERTLVSVPNGKIANMTLEDISSQDKFCFHPILTLSYGTTSPQMCTVLEGIRSLLEESRHLQPTSVRVRFLRFGPSSLDVEIFAYVLVSDFNRFLEIQEKLLLRILECVESNGVLFALPSQAVLTIPTASNLAAERVLLKIPLTESKPGDQVTAAKSA
jgi:small-conductance mechanosensitive channel